jgi:ferrous iron transport protein B
VVVDAANLERNLYLVVQIIEMGAPVIVALNMTDVADARGLRIDVRKLAQGLGVPVVPTVARDKQGIESLGATIAATLTPTQES